MDEITCQCCCHGHGEQLGQGARLLVILVCGAGDWPADYCKSAEALRLPERQPAG